jgi:putative holliday junction resolvase
LRALGLDVGERRIGVAVSDPDGTVAVPVTVIERKSEAAALGEITALIRDHDIDRIIVGMPLSLDGSLGKQAQTVQAFAQSLKECTDVPVVDWDERLSTLHAERMMVEAGVKRGKRKRRLDSVAAAIILQGYLDRQRNETSNLD